MNKEMPTYKINVAQNAKAIFIFAHGAGANMTHDFMENVTELLTLQQISVLRFNFPYMIKREQDGKRRPPDRMPALLTCYQEHIELCRSYFDEHHQTLPIFIGGKSMGGRVAATIAMETTNEGEAHSDKATLDDLTPTSTKPTMKSSTKDVTGTTDSEYFSKEAISGVVCIGYPFHPIKKPENLRLAPLQQGVFPTLIIQGDRDPLGNVEEIKHYELPEHCAVQFLPDGDHDLKPRVKSGFTHQQHIDSAINLITSFIYEKSTA